MFLQIDKLRLKNFVWYYLGNSLGLIAPFRFYGATQKGMTVVNKSTLVTIEAFPRSGNTFLYSLVSQLVDPNKVAHHLHTVSHIKESIRLEVPVIFVIRNPKDAVPSYMIREGISANRAIMHYKQLYEYINQHSRNVLLIDFEEVVKRSEVLYSVLEKTLGHPRKSWNRVPMTEIVKKVEKMDMNNSGGKVDELRVGRPSQERNDLKLSLIENLETKMANELANCHGLYNELLSKSKIKESSLSKPLNA